MSKIRKKEADQRSKQFEIDIKFEKIIQFSGWFFLLALGAFLLGWFLLDNILELFDIRINAMTFSLIIFLGTNSAISFGLASKIKNNRTRKRDFFFDWLLSEFLFCMFAIFAVAAYQW
jgi:hypothetical protein